MTQKVDGRTLRRKVSDDALLEAYERLGNVHKVGVELGINGASVHERLQRIGANRGVNTFSKEDRARLEREYHAFANVGRLAVLAAEMGRTKPFICRQARLLGITDRKRIKPYIAVWKYLAASAVEAMWEDFKSSPLGVSAYCKKRGYDDLGFAKTMRGHFADEWEAVVELKTPKQSKYRSGRQFEYRCRDDLKKYGFFVMRSPASRSPIDLLAIKSGLVLMVQCKRSGALPPSEWNELFDLAASVSAHAVLADIPPGQRGCRYFLMTGRKDGSKRSQPMQEVDPSKVWSDNPRVEVVVEPFKQRAVATREAA